ncbi:Uncharacterized protein DBV15_03250, partial [Temnothorax longispinosus]
VARLRLVGGRPAGRRQTGTSATPLLDLRLSERATYTALTPTRSTYMSMQPGERALRTDEPHRRPLPNGPSVCRRRTTTNINDTHNDM